MIPFLQRKRKQSFLCHLNVSLLQMNPRSKKKNWTWLKRKSIRGLCNHFLLQFLYQFVSICHKSKREKKKKTLIFCHPNLQQIRFFSSSKEVMIYLFSSILHTIFSKPMSSILISPFIISFCNIFIYIHFYHATSSSTMLKKKQQQKTKL